MTKEMKTHKMKEGLTPKSVIARAYAPGVKPGSALKNLQRWITRCTPLHNALKRTGYSDCAKKFSASKSN